MYLKKSIKVYLYPMSGSYRLYSVWDKMARPSYQTSGEVFGAEEKHFLFLPWMSYKLTKGVKKVAERIKDIIKKTLVHNHKRQELHVRNIACAAYI
jgi:hypothetical protein